MIFYKALIFRLVVALSTAALFSCGPSLNSEVQELTEVSLAGLPSEALNENSTALTTQQSLNQKSLSYLQMKYQQQLQQQMQQMQQQLQQGQQTTPSQVQPDVSGQGAIVRTNTGYSLSPTATCEQIRSSIYFLNVFADVERTIINYNQTTDPTSVLNSLLSIIEGIKANSAIFGNTAISNKKAGKDRIKLLNYDIALVSSNFQGWYRNCASTTYTNPFPELANISVISSPTCKAVYESTNAINSISQNIKDTYDQMVAKGCVAAVTPAP